MKTSFQNHVLRFDHEEINFVHARENGGSKDSEKPEVTGFKSEDTLNEKVASGNQTSGLCTVARIKLRKKKMKE